MTLVDTTVAIHAVASDSSSQPLGQQAGNGSGLLVGGGLYGLNGKLLLHLACRTLAVTGPQPKNYDFKTREIGGSRSPLSYPACPCVRDSFRC